MKRASALVAAVLLLGGVAAALLWPAEVAALVQRGETAMRHAGTAGVLAVGLCQILVAASGVLPASLVGIAAGGLYGVAGGFTLAASTTLAGAWLAFRASRSLLRPRIAAVLARRPRLAQVDAGLARGRWRFVCLLRISPVMPFAATSYSLGLSSVSTRDYLLGTLAALPALFGYVCIGALAHAGVSGGPAALGAFRLALFGFGFAATLLLTLQVGRLVARALRLETVAGG